MQNNRKALALSLFGNENYDAEKESFSKFPTTKENPSSSFQRASSSNKLSESPILPASQLFLKCNDFDSLF